MNKEKKNQIMWVIGLIMTIILAIIGWMFFNGNNLNNSNSFQSPSFINSDNNSISYSNSELQYKKVLGSELSGKDGEMNRTIYFPNAKEIYYSGLKLLKGEEWSNNEDDVMLHIYIWDDQIIEIGYSS